jgi:hypothetical protein
MRFLIIIAGLFLLLPTSVLAQYDYESAYIKEQSFDKNTWKKTTENLDYSGAAKNDKNDKSESLDESETGRRGEERKKKSTSSSFNAPLFQGSALLKYLFFSIAIAALAFVLWKIISAQMKLKNPTIKKQIQSLEQAVEDIHESDLERFLREALDANNHKLAIRVYYLMAIKTLSEKDLIKWKKDKTNSAYVQEMRASSHFDSFREITNKFERVWFGDGEISQRGFELLQPKFTNFIKNVL